MSIGGKAGKGLVKAPIFPLLVLFSFAFLAIPSIVVVSSCMFTLPAPYPPLLYGVALHARACL